MIDHTFIEYLLQAGTVLYIKDKADSWEPYLYVAYIQKQVVICVMKKVK